MRLTPNRQRTSLGLKTMALLFSWALLTCAGAWTDAAQPVTVMDISDVPMIATLRPAPANIIFLLDDSGSMYMSCLVKGEYDGRFPDPHNPEEDEGFCDVFDGLGDGGRIDAEKWRHMQAADRKLWKSQWHRVNAMYYDPQTTYSPWPSYENAHPDHPRTDPVGHANTTLDLDEKSFAVDLFNHGLVEKIDVKHAHYFVMSATDKHPYLVVIDGKDREIKYYQVAVTGTGLAE
ncbi:MAG: hypothetical protein JSW39_13675, partial [Desulfobacterales bacterium]